MTEYHCPNCGSSFGPQLNHIKMMNCESCGTSVVVDNGELHRAGTQGEMHDAPLLFGLKDEVRIDRATWRIRGHARFSYGRGTWDEFWAETDAGEGAWISVDEGDVAIQRPLDPAAAPRLGGAPSLGAEVVVEGRRYTVIEVETATCLAVRGVFPEVLAVGETYRFANFTGTGGELLSGEFWPEGQAWSLGDWVDPFDVKVST